MHVPSAGAAREAIVLVTATEVARNAMRRVGHRAKISWIQTAVDGWFRVQNWSHPRRRMAAWIERVEVVAMLVFGVMIALQERDQRNSASTPEPSPPTSHQRRLPHFALRRPGIPPVRRLPGPWRHPA